jgi:hypothetical protein
MATLVFLKVLCILIVYKSATRYRRREDEYDRQVCHNMECYTSSRTSSLLRFSTIDKGYRLKTYRVYVVMTIMLYLAMRY